MQGGFALDAEESRGDLAGVATIALIGLGGENGWVAFANSPEATDGEADPLDRWSLRVVGALAEDLGARPLYPFGGPPHWPFQRWALRAEDLFISPLGLLIHPVYGLWRGYRGALAFAEPIAVPPRPITQSPCERCATRPCLSACPVDAFSAQGYDVAACVTHLRSEAGRPCMERGCLARRACPVGAEHAHGSAQAAFHIAAFLNGQRPG
ncbi:MAG: hypothetical protein E7774_03950 [Bradyrhizobium sp.]|nr:MAG: hypothetical protein E7774_03950 [Bradyrhizobium sp.]